MESDGPMCSRDWPEREVASFLVSSVDRSWDSLRRWMRRDWRYGVELSAEEELCTSDNTGEEEFWWLSISLDSSESGGSPLKAAADDTDPSAADGDDPSMVEK